MPAASSSSCGFSHFVHVSPSYSMYCYMSRSPSHGSFAIRCWREGREDYIHLRRIERRQPSWVSISTWQQSEIHGTGICWEAFLSENPKPKSPAISFRLQALGPAFIERMNALLASGEVPGLFEGPKI